ncbi:precursor of CEP14-like [Solanum dulcamara]|uniref:precursor of CEP14-like n=1 Tax=Solanum dulcamara TaxID=45834 RepID=UPI0024850AC6|nr:precursor of CEP14-like [Solanum dulcamara]
MALSRISASIFLMFLLVLASVSSSTEARKLLNSHEVKKIPNLASLYLNALPKGTVPSSTPSKKGHSYTTDEKLIARHLAAIDRILRSVPSPGVGN